MIHRPESKGKSETGRTRGGGRTQIRGEIGNGSVHNGLWCPAPRPANTVNRKPQINLGPSQHTPTHQDQGSVSSQRKNGSRTTKHKIARRVPLDQLGPTRLCGQSNTNIVFYKEEVPSTVRKQNTNHISLEITLQKHMCFVRASKHMNERRLLPRSLSNDTSNRIVEQISHLRPCIATTTTILLTTHYSLLTTHYSLLTTHYSSTCATRHKLPMCTLRAQAG